MIKRTRNHPGILLLAALLIFAAPAAGHADNLFRLYPEFGGGFLYSDNIPLRTQNARGDYVGTMLAGFYLDYTSAARYASVHYDTFAQLFTHQSQFDRAGEGQFFHATDDENISPTTKMRIGELFYRDAPTLVNVITSDQAPQFNTVAAQLLLARDQASVNHFTIDLSHYWGRNWSSGLAIRQTTFWNDTATSNTSYAQGFSTFTEYHFGSGFALGGGYRYSDFLFTHPGRPGQQFHWPFAKVSWRPLENLFLSGTVGIVVSHTNGSSREAVNPGGLGLVEYNLQRLHVKVYGGQEPELTSSLGGAGNFRYVRGSLIYDFTQRVSGYGGAGFHDVNGAGISGQLVTWGFGLSDRVNKWLRVYARYVQIRSTETGSRQLLPSGTQSGQEAVGNYFVVGLNVSFEALRWSWQ